MPYNSQINRTGAQALMPEDVASDIIQGMVAESVIMSMCKRLPNMPRAQRRLPILGSLVQGYFVQGDTGYKQTSNEQWANKFLNSAEIAVLVPIAKNVLDDVDYDVWSELKPRIIEEFGRVFDSAVLFGTNAPTDWPDPVITQATNVATASGLNFAPSAAAATDIYEAILGETGVAGAIEQTGFMPTGYVASLSMRAKLRGLRDAQGDPIFKSILVQQGIQGPTQYELDGCPVYFPRNGSMDPAQALLFAGDWSQLVWALRTDINYFLIDQGVITDNNNVIQYNLPQQDMVALRATMRLAWELPNPINKIQTDITKRLPFAVLKP